MGLMMTDMRARERWRRELVNTGRQCFYVSYLRWRSVGFSAGCTCQLWAAAAAGFLCHLVRPGCFWTTGMIVRC